MTRNTIHPAGSVLRHGYRAVISAVICMALLLCMTSSLQLDAHAASTERTAGTLAELQAHLAVAEGGDTIQLTAVMYIDSDTEIKAPKATESNPVILYSKSEAGIRHFETHATSKNVTLEFGSVVLDGGGVGGGINACTPNTTIINAVIQNCKTNGFGGGINADDDDLTVINSKIVGNTAGYGAGGGIFGYGCITIIDSEIVDNGAIMGGGGGIAAVGSASKLVIKNSIVKGNTASSDGGGICAEGDLSITHSEVSGNTSTGSDGGGIYGSSTTRIVIEGCVIKDNTAKYVGNEIYTQDESSIV